MSVVSFQGIPMRSQDAFVDQWRWMEVEVEESARAAALNRKSSAVGGTQTLRRRPAENFSTFWQLCNFFFFPARLKRSAHAVRKNAPVLKIW